MSEKSGVHFGSALIGFAIIGVVVGLVYAISAARFQSASGAYAGDPAAVEARIGKVGAVVLASSEAATAPAGQAEAPATAPAPAAASEASGEPDLAAGEAIYGRSCVACHAAGVAGAPKLGDQAAWASRIAQGMDALLNSAVNGKNAMPPRGTCMDCSDADLQSAIAYMVSQSK